MASAIASARMAMALAAARSAGLICTRSSKASSEITWRFMGISIVLSDYAASHKDNIGPRRGIPNRKFRSLRSGRRIEPDRRPYRPRPLLARRELDRPAGRRPHHPLHLRAIFGRIAAPAGPAARGDRFVRAAFQLAELLARGAGFERRAFRQLDLGDEAAHGFVLERALGDIARQPARVLHHETDAPAVRAESRRG